MPTLTLRCLGPLEIRLGGAVLHGFKTRKAQALLVYLARHAGQSFSREHLQSLLWGGSPPERAGDSLRQALANLRRILPADVLLVTRQTAAFNLESDHDLDVARFEATDPPDVRLYRGDFLQGFDLRAAPAWEEWLQAQRERLQARALGALEALGARCAARGEYQAAAGHYRRALALDPWREATHRALMQAYTRAGDRAAALAQYERCRAALAEGLEVAPAEETRALYARIRAAPASPPHNLPPQATPFVGREAELVEIGRRLADPACRLLSLVGPGGVGKTRLALRAAANQRYAFLHGVFFVPLAAVSAPEFLVPALAEALGFSLQGQESPQAQLLNYLREKELLLALDNFEHLLSSTPGGADLLAEILHRAPAVKLLITSRERLNLQWEWLLEVRGLPYPAADTTADGRRPTLEGSAAVDGRRPAVVESYSAVQLFLQRARRVRGGEALAESDAPWAARICQLVEGLPLAIELAAAWVRVLSCAEIAAEIERGLDILTTRLRNVPARHHSLRAVCEHSWELLPEAERRAFRRLSVFQGGFRREAAEAVLGAGRPRATLDALSALVDKSLLRSAQGERYEMHELLRQFAAEKLAQAPEEQVEAQARHTRYYAAFLERREADLKGAQRREALEAIAAEIENVRIAWGRAPAQEMAAEIERSLEGLYLYHELRSWYQAGEAAFGQAVQALGEGETFWKARARQGAFCFRLGLYEETGRLLRDCLAQGPAAHAPDERAFCLYYLAMTADAQGEYARARQCHRESLALCRESGDQPGVARALNGLGILAGTLGEHAEAKRLFQESLALYEAVGARWETANPYINLAIVARELGEHPEAQQLSRKSLAIAEEKGDRRGMGLAYDHLGLVAHEQGEYAEARRLQQEALAIYKDIGFRWGTANCLCNMGQSAWELGENQEAGQYFREALQLALEIQAAPLALEALVGAAAILTREGETERALELLAFAAQHPASDKPTRGRAKGLWAELEGGVSPEAAAVARQRGKDSALEQVAAGVLEAR